MGFANRPVNNVPQSQPLIFLPTKAMQNKFRKFEEIVFYDLWIPDSGFRFPAPDSGFRFPGFRVARKTENQFSFSIESSIKQVRVISA